MKTELELAKENVDTWFSDKYEEEGSTQYCKMHKATCQRWLEFLKKNFKDEICECGCSKKAHQPHQLDKNGGRCGTCVHCSLYTWKEFIFEKEKITDLKNTIKLYEENGI